MLGATSSLPAPADTYLRSGLPNRNQGAETTLRVRSLGRNRALVAFDPAAIQAAVGGSNLLSAHLEFHVSGSPGFWGPSGRLVAAHRLLAPWSEGAATWNCAEDADLTNFRADCATQWNGGQFEALASDSVLHTDDLEGWVSFDVTVDVADFLAGAAHHGWLLKKVEENRLGRVEYDSREGGAGFEPRLVLVTDAAPDDAAPTISITAPQGSFLLNPGPVTVEVGYSDAGSGIDLASFRLTVSGVDRTADCSAGAEGVSCALGLLAAGPVALEARVADLAGNVSVALVSFEVIRGEGPHSAVFEAAADTYLRRGAPNRNQGSEPKLRVRRLGTNRVLIAVDETEVAALLSGADLVSAQLELFVERAILWGPGGRLVSLHRLSQAWSESGATWNCADDSNTGNFRADCDPRWNGGAFEPVATDSVLHTNGLSGWIAFDATADVAAMLAQGSAGHGWFVKKAHEGRLGLAEYSSREGVAGQAPRLVVVFATPDEDPPSLAITAPAAPVIDDPAPEIAVEYSDLSSGVDLTSLVVRLDSADLTASCVVGPERAVCPSPPLADGDHTVEATLADQAGNLATASRTFTVATVPEVDTLVPQLVLAEPAGDRVVGDATPAIRVTFEDPGLGVDLSTLAIGLDGADLLPRCQVTAAEALCEPAALAPGEHYLTAEIADLDGNRATAFRAFDLTLSLDVVVTSPMPGTLTRAAAIDVSGTVAPGATTVTVEGVPATVGSGAFTAVGVPLAEGANTLSVVAENSLGGVGSTTVTVVRDTEAPRVMLFTPSEGFVTTATQTIVTGEVVDLASSNLPLAAIEVEVNGVPAEVDHRSFLLRDLLLQPGENLLTVTARDEAGNVGTTTRVVRVAPATAGRVEEVAGNLQRGAVGTTLAAPLVVRVADGFGAPLAGRAVTFAVSRGDGMLVDFPNEQRSLLVRTDESGLASAVFRLGRRAGEGNHEVTASVQGFPGTVIFCASATAVAPVRVVRIAGDTQMGALTGAVSEPFAKPLLAQVFDSYGNPVPGAQVTYEVEAGGGSFGGDPTFAAFTDADGKASASFTLGPEVGRERHRVAARLADPAVVPARFVLSGVEVGAMAETAVHGLVLDNENQPVPGVTVSIERTALSVTTGAEGRFRIAGAPVGPLVLDVDGSTTPRPGTWPHLAFELVAVSGHDNELGMPIRLLPLDGASARLVGGAEDVFIPLAGVAGAGLTVYAGSTTFPDGSPTGMVSITQVHGDKVPMIAPKGSSFMLAWTVQPPGTRFDPPARIQIPNMGEPSGTVVDMFSFDHDLGEFVPIGTASVGEDGRYLVSNPGSGVIKAGWHGCVPPAAPPGDVCQPGVCSLCGNGGTTPRFRINSISATGQVVPGGAEPAAGGLTAAPNPPSSTVAVMLGTPVQFTATADADCQVHVGWNFGDGTTSTEAAPQHLYAHSGVYRALAAAACNPCATPRRTANVTVVVLDSIDVDVHSSDSETFETPSVLPPSADPLLHFVSARDQGDLVLVARPSPDSPEARDALTWETSAAVSLTSPAVGNDKNTVKLATGSSGKKVPITLKLDGMPVEEMVAWVVSAQMLGLVGAPVANPQTTPSPLTPGNMLRVGTRISGAITPVAEIRPLEIVSDTDQPILDGFKVPPPLLGQHTCGGDLENGVRRRWDMSRRITVLASSTARMLTGCADQVLVFPSDPVVGNDDSTVADPENNDPYPSGELTGFDEPFRFGPDVEPLVNNDSFDGLKVGAVGDTYTSELWFQDFARIQLGPSGSAQWFVIADPLLWRIKIRMRKVGITERLWNEDVNMDRDMDDDVTEGMLGQGDLNGNGIDDQIGYWEDDGSITANDNLGAPP